MGGSGCWVAYTPLAYTEKMKDTWFDRFLWWVIERSDKGEPTSLVLKFLIASPIFIGCIITLFLIFIGSFLPYHKQIPEPMRCDL